MEEKITLTRLLRTPATAGAGAAPPPPARRAPRSREPARPPTGIDWHRTGREDRNDLRDVFLAMRRPRLGVGRQGRAGRGKSRPSPEPGPPVCPRKRGDRAALRPGPVEDPAAAHRSARRRTLQ